MTMRQMPIEAKVEAMERAIILLRKQGYRASDREFYADLKAVAADLRARADRPRNLALGELDRAMDALQRSKTALGYDEGKMIAVAQIVVGKWPTIQQALEMWGEESAE